MTKYNKFMQIISSFRRDLIQTKAVGHAEFNPLAE